MKTQVFFISLLAAAARTALSADLPSIAIAPSRTNALYAAGEAVAMTVTAVADGAPTSMPLRLIARLPGSFAPVVSNVTTAADGTFGFAVTPPLPGAVYLEALALDGKGKPVGGKVSCGAIYRADEIKAALPPPDDFVSFWKGELERLASIPIKATLDPVEIEEQRDPARRIRGAEFAIDCCGPYPSTGYIAMPRDAKPKSLPIIVAFQGATGVRAWKPWHYGDVAISVTVSKFGLPNRLDDAAYKKMGYDASVIYRLARESAASRDDNIFKWMILRDLRAIQYAKSLPEWDGRTLIVNGESLGGGQSIACGALDPDVTLICACVPALSDHNGALAGRRNGWPNLWKPGADGLPQDDAARAVSQVSRYFDTVNFLSIVSTNKEVTIGTGFIDTVCPPEGVYAAFNALDPGVVRTLWTNPAVGHSAGNAHGGKRIREILGK